MSVLGKSVLHVCARMLYDHELITCKLVIFVFYVPFWAILKKKKLIVGLKIGPCIFLCMCGLCHTNQIEATILPCKMWSTNEMAHSNSTSLKVNRGDIDFGHLENVASWKHLNDFSTLSDRNQFFTLRLSNVFIFPASAKLVPYMGRSFGNTTCDDAV